jgi:hypothetical protein
MYNIYQYGIHEKFSIFLITELTFFAMHTSSSDLTLNYLFSH